MPETQTLLGLNVPARSPEAQHDPDSYDWLDRISNHRPETFLLLHTMLLHLVVKGGSVTAEDFHSVPVSHPNVRGAAMKYLRRCGCRPVGITYGKTKESHAHLLQTWALVDARIAHRVLRQFDVRRMK